MSTLHRNPNVMGLARDYLEARRQLQAGMDSMRRLQASFRLAESELIDGIMDAGTDEDDGTSVAVDGVCLALKDECWDHPEGERLTIHKLLQVAS